MKFKQWDSCGSQSLRDDHSLWSVCVGIGQENNSLDVITASGVKAYDWSRLSLPSANHSHCGVGFEIGQGHINFGQITASGGTWKGLLHSELGRRH